MIQFDMQSFLQFVVLVVGGIGAITKLAKIYKNGNGDENKKKYCSAHNSLQKQINEIGNNVAYIRGLLEGGAEK